jgi:hypothetical protein
LLQTDICTLLDILETSSFRLRRVAYPLRFFLLSAIPPILRDERVGSLFLFSSFLRGGCPTLQLAPSAVREGFCTDLAEAAANGRSAAVEVEAAAGGKRLARKALTAQIHAPTLALWK